MIKQTPSDVETEKAILGAILLERDALDKVIQILKPVDFYDERNEITYKACLSLYSKGDPIDLKTVNRKVGEMGQSEKVPSMYLVDCTTVVNSSSNIYAHAAIVKERATRRKLIEVAGKALDQAYEDVISVDDIIENVDKFLISTQEGVAETINLGERVLELIDHVEKNVKARGDDEITGVPTGIMTLDRETGGLKPTDLVIVAARPGMGKALSVNEMVYTPQGKVRIGDIFVGDLICNSYGKFSTVTGVFPQGKRQMFEITFDDGLSVRADGDHLWEVKDRNIRKNNPKENRVISTKQMLEEGLYINGVRKNFSIKYPEPVCHTKKYLIIDPYILGAFIGDGCFSSNKLEFSNTEDDILDKVKKYFGNENISKVSSNDYRIRSTSFRDKLRALNLYGCRSYEKFIPKEYLYSSISDRLDLLRGLIDTDGTLTDGDCRIEYSTSSRQLMFDVSELVRGLGGRVRCTERMGVYTKNGERLSTRTNYRLFISFAKKGLIPVSSNKHLRKYQNNKQFHKRFITSIKPLDIEEEAICIKVDSKDECFLMDNYVVTHNTALIASVMKSMAVDFKRPVGMLSMEMSWVQIGTRIMSMNSDIFLHKLFNGDLDSDEVAKLVYKSNDLVDAPIYIDDSAALSVHQIKAKAKAMKKKFNIECLFVDYIQLAKDSNAKSREQEVASISMSLKAIAKELNICVIALSQLSRKVEDRPDKRPRLSDLRDSGSIEQDADIVMFLWRPEYYGITQADDGTPLNGLGLLDIAKYRNGAPAELWLRFQGELTKWSDKEPLTIASYG